MSAVATLLLLAPQADVVAPRAATFGELQRAVYDTRWVLPATLPLADGPAGDPAVDLEARMRELLPLRTTSADGGRRSVGDLVREWKLAGSDGARERILSDLGRADAPLASAASLLRELLLDDALRRPKWDPDRDDPRDGIAFARPLTLERSTVAPWSDLEGSQLLQQACVLVFADLATIKAAENDYRGYPRRPGATYEWIHPVRDSHVRGADEAGRAFHALRIRFQSDLPFPFGDYTCDLAIWNRVGEDGVPRCDIHSKSRDFLWLAGSDVYLPVTTGDGELVATCIVRRFGFDLRGVPDGDDARRAALRSSLGSLKRESEALERARGAPLRAFIGSLPDFEVRGGR